MKLKALTLAALFASSFAFANNDINIVEPYARATPPSVPNSAIFLTLENHKMEERTLVSASSDAADKVELHNHTMVDGMMKMRQVENIKIAAHKSAVLQPGGLHIMLFGLKNQLVEGEEISLTLTFANGATQSLSIPVKKVMMGMKKMDMSDHGASHTN
ncbi:MAG: copper chaperone PCu(A)C [Aliivibrio sp.]|uniref:copper chaperone PCu(A)C n=1 Tax=Aliivibrio sp. TaxID=1872443 RepID=UPI001A636FCA|nr:copper chaperone PCu(A)C [Aliivibrio sp.]